MHDIAGMEMVERILQTGSPNWVSMAISNVDKSVGTSKSVVRSYCQKQDFSMVHIKVNHEHVWDFGIQGCHSCNTVWFAPYFTGPFRFTCSPVMHTKTLMQAFTVFLIDWAKYLYPTMHILFIRCNYGSFMLVNSSQMNLQIVFAWLSHKPFPCN